MRFLFLCLLFLKIICIQGYDREAENIYDIDAAKSLCDELPLDNLEGVWTYPEDHVTVLILREEPKSLSAFEKYKIRVIEGEDCRLDPGDIIGFLEATSDANIFKIELFSEKKNHIFLKPVSCLASLSKNGDSLTVRQTKSPLRYRVNINLNRLLTGFWKIVGIGLSKNNQNTEPPVGMIKIYPSYDGNGSSKRQPRYL